MQCSMFTFCVFTCLSIMRTFLAEESMNTTSPEEISEQNSEIMESVSSESSTDLHDKDTRGNRTPNRRTRLFREKTTSTTVGPTGFDYWWFFTTSSRPFISYRDYPGKSGVATWKEISPISSKESKKSNTNDIEPTATGALSGSQAWNCGANFAVILIATLGLQNWVHWLR